MTVSNEIADMVAQLAIMKHKAGDYVIIENPASIILWDLDIYQQLANLEGATRFELHTCRFVSGALRKRTALLNNIPSLLQA